MPTAGLSDLEDKSEEGSIAGLPDLGDDIDAVVFEQILEMDDDDEREFSRGLVFQFFDQAEETFKDMDKALKDKDLKKLSDLGHFLKGSSAALGLTKIRQSCEKIQNCGQGRTENGGKDEPDDAKSLERIADTLKVVKDEYAEAEKALRKFYAT